MAIQQDCQHYIMQTVRGSERIEKCRLGASQQVPFACPDGCVFYESRSTSSAGWQVAEHDRPETDPPTAS